VLGHLRRQGLTDSSSQNMPTKRSHGSLSGEVSVRGTIPEVFRAFLKLGVSSFGGPIAHLGYFRDELVVRRKWLDEATYADLVALCQFLPGPASSQVGFSLGVLRGKGLLGGLAAWFARIELGLALGEGSGLALAGAGRLVELAAQALVLGLEVVDASL